MHSNQKMSKIGCESSIYEKKPLPKNSLGLIRSVNNPDEFVRQPRRRLVSVKTDALLLIGND